mgnify:CR=1 FL=1
MSPTQRKVLGLLTVKPLSLVEIKAQLGGRHGPTQALYALCQQGRVEETAGGIFRRVR